MKNKNGKSPSKQYAVAGWVFIIPFIIMFAIFMVYPIFDSFYMTFFKIDGFETSFVGLNNYKRLFTDSLVWKSLGNTFLYTIVQVPVMLLLAMILSTLVNSHWLKLRGGFRTALFLPCVISLVSYSLIFRMMFSNDGIINQALISLGLTSESIGWLQTAGPARILIIIALIWRWTGYNMMFFLSYLQNIDQATMEAAEVDGANAFQKFIRITFPQMKPIFLFCAIMTTIGTLQVFDETFNITKGNPNYSTISISHYIYNKSFVSTPDFSYSATISYLVVIILVILSIIEFRVMKEDNT